MEKALETVIVMEEAHNFIRRYSSTSDDIQCHTVIFSKIFEKIAREEDANLELGMVLLYREPSELLRNSIVCYVIHFCYIE